MFNAVLRSSSHDSIFIISPKSDNEGSYRSIVAQDQKSIVEAATHQSHVLDRPDWNFDMDQIWAELNAEATGDGHQPLQAGLKPLLSLVLRCAALQGLPFPSISAAENGGFEAFFKSNERGLLISGNSDLSVQAFGDFNGEIWRAKLDRSMPRSRPVTADQIRWLMQRY